MIFCSFDPRSDLAFCSCTASTVFSDLSSADSGALESPDDSAVSVDLESSGDSSCDEEAASGFSPEEPPSTLILSDTFSLRPTVEESSLEMRIRFSECFLASAY